MSLRYVITGCGGSGTGFTSWMMRHMGSPCGHEDVFDISMRTPDRTFEGDSSWLAVPHLGALDPGVRVVHLLRHPLNVIRSLERVGFLDTMETPYDTFVAEHSPYIAAGQDQLGRLIRYVATWDRRFPSGKREFEVFWPTAAGVYDWQRLYRHLSGRTVNVSTVLGALKSAPRNSHGGRQSPIHNEHIQAHPDAEIYRRHRRWLAP